MMKWRYAQEMQFPLAVQTIILLRKDIGHEQAARFVAAAFDEPMFGTMETHKEVAARAIAWVSLKVEAEGLNG
jgi:hypothetical protein